MTDDDVRSQNPTIARTVGVAHRRILGDVIKVAHFSWTVYGCKVIEAKLGKDCFLTRRNTVDNSDNGKEVKATVL